MTWSLSEAQALAVKAARGAGYPWGLAEEAGFALRWLSAHGLPGPEVLAELFESGCIGATPCGRCPLAQGAAIADLGATTDEAVTVRYPLLMVPFAAGLMRPVTVQWEGASVSVVEAGVMVQGRALLAPEGLCTITSRPAEAGEPAQPLSRIPTTAGGALDILTELAARTYAPATEASRLAGAGAGTTDND